MDSNPCNVCGGTELNLVDGFYYCVECGTQDVNVRETVVEKTVLADGTFAHVTSKKFTTILKDGIEMSSEWYKWHAFNFILNGLTEELISLGAAPSVKRKVLWIWVRYIKKFQVKEDFDKTSPTLDENAECNKGVDEDVFKGELDSENTDKEEIQQTKETKKPEKFRKDVKIITKGTILAILYVALNLDRSNIQLSDLFRYINEGRLSLYSCTKYVPKEINIKTFPYWKNFILCQNKYTPKVIRAFGMTLFKRLDLGVPIVPDLTKLLDIYLKELCLPLDFRNFVLGFIHLIPCDFLQINQKSMKYFLRIPDYEGVCMSYILMSLKICFGLDGDYELKLSDEIDRINYEEKYLKSYKLGFISEPTDRLFSFRDWYKFIQFRKMVICKYYLPMARRYNLPVEDDVLMEHLEERSKRRTTVSNDVTMDILKKIPLNEFSSVIPKREFTPTFTPLTTYTEVILQYIQDPDLRLLLCEDFTQYSLKYACKDLKLPGSTVIDDLIVGVSETNKTINRFVHGNLAASYKGDKSLVFVRSCENENWLETKPPGVNHIIKTIHGSLNEKDSDYGYDSNSEATLSLSLEINDKINEESVSKVELHEHIAECIEEEGEGTSIYDDDFGDINLEDSKLNFSKGEDNHNLFPFEYNNINDENSMTSDNDIDLENFDRAKIIKELIEIACKKYKIPKPKENTVRLPQKRKQNVLNGEASQRTAKRRREVSKRGETKSVINEIVSSYYENLGNDIIHQISEHVKSVVQNVENMTNHEPNMTNSILNTNWNETELQNLDPENITNVPPLEDNNASDINSLGPNSTFDDTFIDADVDSLFPKCDPDFDKDTHDIKQLYLKLEEEEDWNFQNVFDVDDVNLDKIIDKKIEEFARSDEHPKNSQEDNSDPDDDLECVLQEEKEVFRRRKKRFAKKLERLITRPFNIKRFNVWIRYYKSRCVTRSLDMSEKFDFELNENCPLSFVFVIRECASILECTTFSLYKSLQRLEKKLIMLND